MHLIGDQMKLREYQQEDVTQLVHKLKAHKNVIYRLPTGGGKTVVAGALALSYLDKFKDHHVWFCVHRRELVQQAVKTFNEFGYRCGVIAAGWPRHDWHHLQVASVQTLVRRVREMHKLRHEPEFIIIDEGHHCRARTYREILNAFPDALVLLITATPERSDGRGMADVADVLYEGEDEQGLIDLGYLAKPEMYIRDTPIAEVSKITRGEYDMQEQAEAARKSIADAVAAYQYHADGKRTIVFATCVEHSIKLAERFSDAGYRAKHIDGTTSIAERDRALQQFHTGNIQIITNCQILTEGFDCPDTECVILARKTASFGLYRQMVGRVMRPGLDKVVLDLAGNYVHGRPEAPHTWNLLNKPRGAKKIKKEAMVVQTERMWVCPPPCFAMTAGPQCHVCGADKPSHIKPPKEVNEKLKLMPDNSQPRFSRKQVMSHLFREAFHIMETEGRVISEREVQAIGDQYGYSPFWGKKLHPIVSNSLTKPRRMA